MRRRNCCRILAALTLAAGWGLGAPTAAPAGELAHLHGGKCVTCRPESYEAPDLFYNFYVPGYCGGVPAQMYLAPRPVPPIVGQTYITYQPFMPHEMLYPHHERYYHYYDNGRGFDRTSVRWYRPPVVNSLKALRNTFEIPR
jgi:hypothetical protein